MQPDNIQYVPLKDKITVFCPVLQARINIASEIASELDEYNQYLLWYLGRGKKLDQI